MKEPNQVTARRIIGLHAMAKYQIDNKMANNNHVIHFMYGLQYVLISLFYHDNLWLPEGHG